MRIEPPEDANAHWWNTADHWRAFYPDEEDAYKRMPLISILNNEWFHRNEL